MAYPAASLRGPVTPKLLISILEGVKEVASSPYECQLFQAVFLLALFAFLQLGEYTLLKYNLMWHDIMLMRSAIKLRFISFKFSRGQVAEILLSAIGSSLCPVEAMHHYRDLRPVQVVYCFVDSLGQPASQVPSMLQGIASLFGLPQGYITPHSFHIGAATSVAVVYSQMIRL